MLLSARYQWNEITISSNRDCSLDKEVSIPYGVEPGYATHAGRRPMLRAHPSHDRDYDLEGLRLQSRDPRLQSGYEGRHTLDVDPHMLAGAEGARSMRGAPC